jgi:hypothetical protein
VTPNASAAITIFCGLIIQRGYRRRLKQSTNQVIGGSNSQAAVIRRYEPAEIIASTASISALAFFDLVCSAMARFASFSGSAVCAVMTSSFAVADDAFVKASMNCRRSASLRGANARSGQFLVDPPRRRNSARKRLPNVCAAIADVPFDVEGKHPARDLERVGGRRLR